MSVVKRSLFLQALLVLSAGCIHTPRTEPDMITGLTNYLYPLNYLCTPLVERSGLTVLH